MSQKRYTFYVCDNFDKFYFNCCIQWWTIEEAEIPQICCRTNLRHLSINRAILGLQRSYSTQKWCKPFIYSKYLPAIFKPLIIIIRVGRLIYGIRSK